MFRPDGARATFPDRGDPAAGAGLLQLLAAHLPQVDGLDQRAVGLANLADSLVAVDEMVYRSGEMTLADFYAVCRDDFEGHEPLRQRILNTMPKYGNDDDEVDGIASAWADFLSNMTESFPVGGHRYVPGFFCHVNHMLLGDRTGATPGRSPGAGSGPR